MIKYIKIGTIDAFRLSFKDSFLDVVPDFGANISKLSLHGQKVLDGNETSEDLKNDTLCKSDFLAPFPNRIDCGTYTFNGRTHTLIANETARGHALHGLIIKKRFEIGETIENTDFVQASFTTSIAKDEFQGYPFDLSVTITLKLMEKSLTITLRGKNTGDTEAPYGVGWHPYFTTGKKIDNCMLTIPAREILDVGKAPHELIPNGNRLPNEFGTEKILIGSTFFDTCFVTLEKHHVQFENVELWFDPSMKFVQMYTPEDRMSIAIEPMSCAPNAFNSGDGLIVLKPGEEIEHVFGVRVS